ncbi:MAG: hypothetical protein ACR2QL_02415 [Woeseiaceae bacterium]
MRSLVVMAMFASSLTYASWNGYTETRDLELPASGVDILEIDAGAGSILVTGVADSTDIVVRAIIRVPDDDEDDAQQLIAEDLVLKLEKKRSKAKLDAYFEHGSWSVSESAAVDLEVSIPQGLEIFVDDGSGSMIIENVQSAVEVDDGSGSIEISGATSVVVDDGSGPVRITNVSGDVEVEDGSGDIKVRAVGGTVTIDDGSGGIDVRDVEHDLDIVDDGSGSVHVADVRGTVTRDD